MSTRRHFLVGSTAALGLAAQPAAPEAHAAPPAARTATTSDTATPNFVVILADDLGYGDLGAYGQKLITTPRIDRLAAEGLRFTDAYSTAAVCAPSRCSLLTGLHTGHSAVRANPGSTPGALKAGDTTFAEVLRARGYRTALIGKWGFGPEEADQPSHPNSRGFEEFYGYIDHGHAHEYYPQYLWHNGVKETIAANAGGAKGAYAPHLIEQRALDFVAEHAAEPFLLFLAPTVPHAPSDIPDVGAYASRSWTAQNKGHAAQITSFDTLVGNLTDRLRALGIDGSTVVLVTSDNGPHEEGGVNPDLFDANGPLRGYKRNLYEGGIRVPLIAWSPGRIGAGTTDRPTSLTDVLPTLAELGGAPAPTDIDGLSAAALLAGSPDAARHDHLYWYRDERGVTSRANTQDGGRATWLAEAVRKDDWKAVRFAPVRDHALPDAQWQLELYDLASDLGEQRNVADANPSVVAGLVALMRSSWVETYVRRPFGAMAHVQGPAVPGRAFTVTGTLGNGSGRPWTRALLTLRAPAGWQVQATTPAGQDLLAAGAALTTTWRVTPPATAAPGTRWPLTVDGTAESQTGPLRFSATEPVSTVPPAPVADAYLSDLPWVSATNGWGPVEIDRSNGRKAAGDGTPISFGGVTYAKGLGVHAPSEIVYHLGGTANRFTARVGIDDFSTNQAATGATRASVRGDGKVLFTSGKLTGASGPVQVDVDVRGVRMLHLVVEDANANSALDHTSWALARVTVL
ncbi:sulfatase-like hydrolase/transferase [Streptomyces bambusae]|uniref:sulfatase-like hydrolase/transferase n=1 Tax=Streptomyces bambusae TaxID=1550616 RepID=UPI001CFCF8BC|nr:sulfatase-like hydrolase/transferase [Streptomyces bambusae]MCB5164538.1 sulfatase-like hydrolase/transferase [Streptomyces bambusae]